MKIRHPGNKKRDPWDMIFESSAVGIKNKDVAMFTGDIEYVLKVQRTQSIH